VSHPYDHIKKDDKERRVDYSGRAGRGALWGGGVGVLGGGALGSGVIAPDLNKDLYSQDYLRDDG